MSTAEAAAIQTLSLVLLDTSGTESFLTRVGNNIAAGFAPEMRQVGAIAGRSVDLDFRNQGRPNRWKPLAASTIRERLEARARGKNFVAQIDTILRVTDTLRKAASASQPGVTGSDVTADAWQWQNEVTLDYAPRQNDLREFMFFQDTDEEQMLNVVNAGVRARITKAERGQ
jgi:phage gpG-like protein